MTQVIILLILFTTTSCTLAGDPNTVKLPLLVMGIWHGGSFIISSIVAIFSDISISYYKAPWTYDLGFVFGVLFLSWNWGLLMGVFSLGIYILNVKLF